jgi:BirA family biotin operon repressor/biotin-[acetyl-CoA-carboxylase] ligase
LGRRVHRPFAEIAPIGLVVGVAVADALRRLDVSRVSLKWPNDVLIDGAKAGGILLEVAGATAPQIVVGVGLNVGGTAEIAARLGHTVGEIRRRDAPLPRNALAAAVIDAIVQRTSEFEADGFGAIRERWAALDAYRDSPVRIHAATGDTFGIARGVTETGELRLETDGGVVAFNSGEVSLRGQG